MIDGDSLDVLTAGERTFLAALCKNGDDGVSQLDGPSLAGLYRKRLLARIGSHWVPTEQGREVNERN